MYKMVTWKLCDYMYHLSAHAFSLVLTPVTLTIVTSAETETRHPSCFAFPVIVVNKSYLVLLCLTSHKVSEPYSNCSTAASISARPPFWCLIAGPGLQEHGIRT